MQNCCSIVSIGAACFTHCNLFGMDPGVYRGSQVGHILKTGYLFIRKGPECTVTQMNSYANTCQCAS